MKPIYFTISAMLDRHGADACSRIISRAASELSSDELARFVVLLAEHEKVEAAELVRAIRSAITEAKAADPALFDSKKALAAEAAVAASASDPMTIFRSAAACCVERRETFNNE